MRVIIPIIALFINANANANNFTWNGVFTQGLFHTDDNNIYGKSEDEVSFDFTEFSLNGSYNFQNNMHLSGQAIYRHAGAGFDGINLDYLFVDKTLFQKDFFILGARAGRQKTSYGILNATRDIAFTRPSVYTPMSIYQDLRGRDTILYYDGIGTYLNYFTDDSIFNFELSYGKVNDSDFGNFLVNTGSSDPVDLNIKADDAVVLNFTFEGPILLKYSLIYSDTLEVSTSIDPQGFMHPLPLPPINVKIDSTICQQIFSFRYDSSNWSFFSEYSKIRASTKDPVISIDPIFSSLTPAILGQFSSLNYTETEAFYFQVNRHITPRLSGFIRHDILDESTNTTDNAIGIIWTPRRQVLVNVEYHNVDGTRWLNPNDNPDIDSAKRHWNILAASFSYRF